MTQEEKAIAYDKAIERAKKLKEEPQSVFYEFRPKEGDTWLDYIFPELKETGHKIMNEENHSGNMTLKEKALEYDCILEKARKLREKNGYTCQKCLKGLFGVLSESYDERIRKGLIKGLLAMRDIHKHQTFSDDAIDINDAIEWLEREK